MAFYVLLYRPAEERLLFSANVLTLTQCIIQVHGCLKNDRFLLQVALQDKFIQKQLLETPFFFHRGR